MGISLLRAGDTFVPFDFSPIRFLFQEMVRPKNLLVIFKIHPGIRNPLVDSMATLEVHVKGISTPMLICGIYGAQS